MFKDLRKAIRIKDNIPVKIYTADCGYVSDGKTVDLSVGGMKILVSDNKLSLGSEFIFEVHLRKVSIVKEIKIKGKVIRDDGDGTYGIQFIEPDLLTKSKIRDYIEHKLKECRHII